MQVSNLQLAFENRLVIRCLRAEENYEQVITILRQSAKEDLAAQSPTTGASILFYAVQRPNDEEATALCKFLCEKLNVCSPNHLDCNRQTAMFFAGVSIARDGNAGCVEYFVKEHKCDPNQLDSASQTALFYAARDGRLTTIRALIDLGADINIADQMGQTAIFYAARDGRTDTVSLMIEKGANIFIRDKHRRTAIYYAQRNNHKDLATLLKHAGESSGNHTPTKGSLEVNEHSSEDTLNLVPTQRKLYRLCLKGPNDMWIPAPPEEIEKFEKLVPSVSVWSKTIPSPVVDIFYLLKEEWQPVALKIVDHLSQTEGGWIFAKPVDCKAWGCPDYYDVITNPMDFTTVKKKFKNKLYHRCGEYLSDFRLIFSNCFRYNKPDSHVANIARTVENTFKELLETHKFDEWIQKEEEIEKWYQERIKLEVSTISQKEQENSNEKNIYD